jgi:hypothetical protein
MLLTAYANITFFIIFYHLGKSPSIPSNTPLTPIGTLRYNNYMTEQRIKTSSREPRPGKTPPDHIGVLLAALVMMLAGWGGLYLLVTTSTPRIGAELWTFFLLLHIAVTGTTLPAVRTINMMLTKTNQPPPPGGVIVRQSVWLGLYVVITAWLKLLRVLTVPIGLFLPVVFIVVEVFLRLREMEGEI